MRARTWNLRMNLDTFNSGYAALDNEQDRAEFLTGLYKGMNGGKVKDDCSDPMSVGFAVGQEMRTEAENFRVRSVENGSKRKSNRNDQTVDRGVYLTVDQTCTQSTIHNPQSTNEQPQTEKASSPSRARSSKKKEPLSPPEEFLADLSTIAKDWPRRSDYKGAVASVSVLSRPEDVWERIVKFVPEADRSLAIRCALLYLDELDARERGVKGLIPNVCAMTNFYGEAAKWKSMIAKVEEKRGPG